MLKCKGAGGRTCTPNYSTCTPYHDLLTIYCIRPCMHVKFQTAAFRLYTSSLRIPFRHIILPSSKTPENCRRAHAEGSLHSSAKKVMLTQRGDVPPCQLVRVRKRGASFEVKNNTVLVCCEHSKWPEPEIIYALSLPENRVGWQNAMKKKPKKEK